MARCRVDPQRRCLFLASRNSQAESARTSNQKFNFNAYQIYDDAFLTKGNHSLKFGVAFERDQNNMLTRLYPNAQVSFGSLASFLLGQAQSFTAILPTVPITPRDLRQSIFGTYIQDDWRIRPNLTMNMGMRYEMATVPTETKNRLSRLNQCHG